jgi:hypothetical protein
MPAGRAEDFPIARSMPAGMADDVPTGRSMDGGFRNARKNQKSTVGTP